MPQSASITIPVAKAPPSSNNDVIDKSSFFSAAGDAKAESQPTKPKSAWVCADLRPVPAFYPLEKSSRFVDDEKDNVTERLAEVLRVLSVQADFNSEVVRLIACIVRNLLGNCLWNFGNSSWSVFCFVGINRRVLI